MKEEKKESPIGVLWGWGKPYHGKFIGSIILGGYELKDIPLSEISDQISYVSQDNYLFNRSIRENIRMGRPSATDAEVEQAAKQSGCDAFIRRLDNGYDTIVGSAGSYLSGGERQRISIARAMLKNASIIILDEATGSVDPAEGLICRLCIVQTGGYRLETGSVKGGFYETLCVRGGLFGDYSGSL